MRRLMVGCAKPNISGPDTVGVIGTGLGPGREGSSACAARAADALLLPTRRITAPHAAVALTPATGCSGMSAAVMRNSGTPPANKQTSKQGQHEQRANHT
eukprot:1141331-Prorocentrum_minimum.AAC.1